MKIAVISDIHGNMDALESVLKRIKELSCSKIFCLGDIAMAGAEPQRTISRIKQLMQENSNFYIIRGNTDRMLSVFSLETLNSIAAKNKIMGSAYEADSRLLTAEEKEFLGSLSERMELEIKGIKILLVHGSPRRDDENIYPDMDISSIEEMVKNTDADVIFCGHTHMPCGYQTNTGKTIVNAGSSGRPFSDKPDVCFAVMNIDEETKAFEIHHEFVKYDVQKAADKLRARNFTGADKLAQMLIHAVSRYPE